MPSIASRHEHAADDGEDQLRRGLERLFRLPAESRIEAKLLNHAQIGQEQSLTLESDGFIFNAYQRAEDGRAYARLENNSLVDVTGICLVEPVPGWRVKLARKVIPRFAAQPGRCRGVALAAVV